MDNKILVVDDEPDILKTLEFALTDKSYEVHCALDGKKAIQLLQTEGFDVVITDIRMPGMDGLKLMQEIKIIDPGIEVVILTGFATIENAIQALREEGAFDYLRKPLEAIDELYIVINKALERSRLRRENKALLKELKNANDNLSQRVREKTRELTGALKELKNQKNSLEETNTALKVVLAKRDEDRIEIEEKLVLNINKLVLPYLQKIKKSGQLDKKYQAYLDVLDLNVRDIVSPFGRKLPLILFRLSPAEIEVANLVKQGRRTKEIAEIMILSKNTIDSYRRNIRKKLGIANKKVNLRSYLLTAE
ncbi:MAG: response regulator [Deltaproteobacteria bacterium]|nr:response regulator [Deltaproteobacteria bacterium]